MKGTAKSNFNTSSSNEAVNPFIMTQGAEDLRKQNILNKVNKGPVLASRGLKVTRKRKISETNVLTS